MDFATIQAQIANLTSLVLQYAEKTTRQSVPTFGESYRQEYQEYQHPQRGWDNSDWSDHSNSMCWEHQQVHNEAYWQPSEQFYSEPMQPPQQFQPTSGSSIDYNQILEELNSLVQGSQNQVEVAQQDGYWQQEDEFYSRTMQPSQPPPQHFQSNSSMPMTNDEILDVLTSLTQSSQEDEPKTSQTSLNIDAQRLFEEEEEEKATAREEPPLPQPLIDPPPLPQHSKAPTPSNSGKVVPYSILFDPVPLNVPIPCRFNEEEGKKGIVETLPKIQEEEVDGDCLELIKEDVFATTIPNEVEVYDTGQVTILTINLAKSLPNLAEFSSSETFEVVFVLEFVSEYTGKPPPQNSSSFYTNMWLMIQAPTLQFKPLPDHFKYHLPLKDKFHNLEPRGV